MARRAKPANLHVLEGNPNRLTKKELEDRLKAEKRLKGKKDKLKPPKHLNDVAKKKFKAVVKELQALDEGLICNLDVDMLCIYCQLYSDYIQMTQIIEEEGYLIEARGKAETKMVAHPLLMRRKDIENQMLRLASHYGFTPSARASLARPKKEEKPKSEAELLFGDRL
jgi:P27 family predicted phage terminase small subunit